MNLKLSNALKGWASKGLMVQSIYELMMQGWTVLEQIASEFCLIKGPSFSAFHLKVT